MSLALACLLTFASSAALDYAHARYLDAARDFDPERAGLWSVVQWAAAAVGFVAAVKVSLAVLPFEALGLYVGTRLGVGRSRPV